MITTSHPRRSRRARRPIYPSVSHCLSRRAVTRAERGERTNANVVWRVDEQVGSRRASERADARARARAASGNGGPCTGDPRPSLAVHSDRTDFTPWRRQRRRRQRRQSGSGAATNLRAFRHRRAGVARKGLHERRVPFPPPGRRVARCVREGEGRKQWRIYR